MIDELCVVVWRREGGKREWFEEILDHLEILKSRFLFFLNRNIDLV